MYTRCPNCTTIFRVTAEQLRTTYGDIPCLTCAQPFNALDSLADDITALITTPVDDTDSMAKPITAATQPPPDTGTEPADLSIAADDIETTTATDDDTAPAFAEFDTAVDDAQPTSPGDDVGPHADEQNERIGEADGTENSGDAGDVRIGTERDDMPGDEPARALSDVDHELAVSNDTNELAPVDDDEPVDSMEFDAPEQTWSKFFLVSEVIASQQDGERKPTLKTEAEAGVTPLETRLSIDDTAIRQPWISNDDTESFEFQTANHLEWKKFLVELNEEQATTTAENTVEDQPPHTAAKPDPLQDAEPALDPPAEPDSFHYAESALDRPADPEPFDFSEPVFNDADELGPLFADDQMLDPSADVDMEQSADASISALWLTDDSADETATPPEFRYSRAALGTCVALTLVLGAQLLHYNRDALAANNRYGAVVQQVYALFGAPLYPDWRLDAFEVTGTEAISGRSSNNALDILANVIVHGQEPVGLPLIRVVLRDRWTNPVAARVFKPQEYLREFDTGRSHVNPGDALAIEISVADPGAEALGYVVDVCLPRRKSGLECQISKDPFQ